MEAIVAEPTDEGQAPKTATEAVSEVLSSTRFLQNVGLETSAPKKNATGARVQELEAQVQAERLESEALRSQIEYQQNQLEALTSKIEETEAADHRRQEELSSLRKEIDETNSLL
ncbi:unnamed protein product [Urochloa humidicola]